MIKKIKNIWNKLCLAWYIFKAENDLVLTESVFHSSTKNLDLLPSDKIKYDCLENNEGGYDIVYMIPWNNGKKLFTFTVSRLKGANAGAIADATLDILNKHVMTGMVTGDSKNQPEPTNYIPKLSKEI